MSPQKIQSGRSGLKGFTEASKEYGNTSQTEVITFHAIDSVPTEIQEALKKPLQILFMNWFVVGI